MPDVLEEPMWIGFGDGRHAAAEHHVAHEEKADRR